uniref:G-protein coupled receptors family 1 profile domain-containing protein n=1 Tax=Monopterus albus TaxID=43700 RepID=A0A3Q3K6Y4_MONAL
MVLISVDRYVAICDPIVFLLHNNLEPPGRYNSCYGEVFVVAVSQARAMRSHVATVKLQRSGTVMTKKSELKAAGTLGVVVAVFLLCYCPFYGLCQTGSNMLVGSVLESFMSFVMFSNSGLNPLLYALFYPWFRKSFKNIMTLQILQPGSRDSNILSWPVKPPAVVSDQLINAGFPRSTVPVCFIRMCGSENFTDQNLPGDKITK